MWLKTPKTFISPMRFMATGGSSPRPLYLHVKHKTQYSTAWTRACPMPFSGLSNTISVPAGGRCCHSQTAELTMPFPADTTDRDEQLQTGTLGRSLTANGEANLLLLTDRIKLLHGRSYVCLVLSVSLHHQQCKKYYFNADFSLIF